MLQLLQWYSEKIPGRLLPQEAWFSCFLDLVLYFILLAVLGLCCCAWASHCGGFFCCEARALGMRASVVVARGLQQLWQTGFRSCCSRAVEHRLSSCDARA